MNKYLNSYNGNTKQDELQNYAYILKWLQIFPLVQLVLLNNKVYINYFSNLLPLAFISGLKYNANWHKVIGEAFQDEAEKSETLKILKLQESEYDIINGVEDQRAVSLNGEYPNISNILEISDMENEEDFLKLQAECTKMIHKYCTEAISEKVDFLLSEMSLEEEKSLLKGYLEKEINIFRNLVERFENKEDLTLPEELSKEEWEYERTNPRFYY